MNGVIKLLGMAGFVLASGALPLFADSPTVALEPTKTIIYPNPADIIPAPPPKSPATAPSPPANSTSGNSIPTASTPGSPPPGTATSAPDTATGSPLKHLSSLSNGWYLRWGPFKDRATALAAYPTLQTAFSEPEFSQAVWSLQQVGLQWTVLAGPIPEAALGRALWAPQAPSGLYRP